MHQIGKIGLAFFIILAVAPLAQADITPLSLGRAVSVGYLATVLIETLVLFAFLRRVLNIGLILVFSILLNAVSYPITWVPLLKTNTMSALFISIFVAEVLIIAIEAVLLKLVSNFLVKKRRSFKKLNFRKCFGISSVMNVCSFFVGLPLSILLA